jgi:hypothetical protein
MTMLVETITFEIRDFNTGAFEDCVVENTELNYSLISRHRFTRGIEFVKMFDFEFTGKAHTPKFIEFGLAVAESLEENKNIMNIDPIDEMVGTF